jgi:hypothetical protein
MNVSSGKNSWMRWSSGLIVGIAAVIFVGCSTNPKVLPTTGPHPATDPNLVMVYQTPPSQYEILGQVEAPIGGNVHWDDQGNADAGFDLLRRKAAEMGGNGLLMAAAPNTTDLLVIAGYHGMMYKVPVRSANPKAAVCQAIWVVAQ